MHRLAFGYRMRISEIVSIQLCKQVLFQMKVSKIKVRVNEIAFSAMINNMTFCNRKLSQSDAQ